MSNLSVYEQVRQVPEEAQKKITGGRLSGMTDINPMWRLKKLTELFGPCGIGWKYIIAKQWIETGADGNVSAFTNVDLYIKHENEWSEAIPGTGGSSFVTKEKNGLYTSDECYKMALTDAISVACKALGMGADVYWQQDVTKYNRQPDAPPSPPPNVDKSKISEAQQRRLFAISKGKEDIAKRVLEKYGYSKSSEIERVYYNDICDEIQAMP